MLFFKYTKTTFLSILSVLAISCSKQKRLYISNETGKILTISVNSDLDIEKGSVKDQFKDSLDGKCLYEGSTVISYDVGKWSKKDKEDLKSILENVTLKSDRQTINYCLPKNLEIGNGLLIPELIVKIKELDKIEK